MLSIWSLLLLLLIPEREPPEELTSDSCWPACISPRIHEDGASVGPGGLHWCESGHLAGGRGSSGQDPDRAKFKRKMRASGLLPVGLSWADSPADTLSQASRLNWGLSPRPSGTFFLQLGGVRDREEHFDKNREAGSLLQSRFPQEPDGSLEEATGERV